MYAESPQYRQWRRVKDQVTTGVISVGGVAVLGAILLIFFYLLYEIMPLFQAATLSEGNRYDRVGDNSPTLLLAVEEQGEMGMRLDSSGTVTFFSIDNGAKLQSKPLLKPGAAVSGFALESEQSGMFALGLADGRALIAKHKYKSSYPQGKRVITPRVEFPYGSTPLNLAAASISQLALRDTEDGLVLVGVSGGQLQGRRWVKEEDFLSGDITVEEETLDLPLIDITPRTLLIGPNQKWLYVLGKGGEYRLIDLDSGEVADGGSLFAYASLTNARFLLGGISLITSNSKGLIQQWFTVQNEDGVQLQEVRSFGGSAAKNKAAPAITNLTVEHRRKGLISVDENNRLSLYYTTSERQLLQQSLGDVRVTDIAISPRAKTLLVETADGQLQAYDLHNEHPETSWKALWQKVWYESYEEPDYIWQSSASDNDFEPKYSFAPLAFGTLKAAFYAMLLAAPLAICGAIYTAYFMAPAMRRKVKPLIELMEALPTVILGFLAGLWLAPFIEGHLPAIFAIFLLLPVGVLLFGWSWHSLPINIRKHVPDGWHALLLVPVILLTIVLCVELSAPMERALFAGDMRAWLTTDLGISFDQRNALVVGIAMGFAVIPTIFSIAEDAIFSVPKHLSYGSLALGATPWQTLVGVVMPTASPGIFSAVMIGMGRAVGETMIVLMATGNTPVMDANIFEGMRTLAANIAVEIGETEVDSTHYRVLFLAAFVLFSFTFVVNTAAEVVRQRLRKRYGEL